MICRLVAYLVVIGLLAGGCSELQEMVADPDATQRPVQLLALVDNSGSFSYRQASVNVVLLPALECLRAGDQFIVRQIQTHSAPAEDLVNIRVPGSDRPFDTQAETRRSKVVAATKQQLLQFATDAPKSCQTDIIGGIASIASVPRRENARRLLLVCSDMLDTQLGVDALASVDLSATDVIVMYCQFGGDPAQHQKRLARWQQAFEQAGAESVRIFTPTASRAVAIDELLAGGD